MVASSVEAFIAQRLIRVICPECKYEDRAAPLELKALIAKDLDLESPEEVRIHRGKGCANCNFTGFFGRTAIYEILLVDEVIKDLIFKKTRSSQIKKISVSRGMQTLRQDGWRKTMAGVTTPEEVMKVTSVEEEVVTERQAQEPLDTERRIYQRLPNRIHLSYKVFKSQEEITKRGITVEQLSVTKNISAGGLLFISKDNLPAGSILDLKIELPDDEKPIECLARVVRVEETGRDNNFDIAVCFLDITSAQRVRLDRFVETVLR